jgi:hypothetical protein
MPPMPPRYSHTRAGRKTPLTTAAAGPATGRDHQSTAAEGEKTMNQNTELVRGAYAAFARGDIPAVLGLLAPDASWTEAEGGPYGGTFIGPQGVLDNVFMKIGGEWDGYAAIPEEFVANDHTVVALGTYSGTYKATGSVSPRPSSTSGNSATAR